jgi:hypothetical protein
MPASRGLLRTIRLLKTKRPAICRRFSERLMGFEPTTFCGDPALANEVAIVVGLQLVKET